MAAVANGIQAGRHAAEINDGEKERRQRIETDVRFDPWDA